MNEKLNMRDFFESLAIRHGMSRGNAESFVKDFFNQVEDSLLQGKSVKIDGFGTFEHAEGNNQISFTPDGPIKDVGMQLSLFDQPSLGIQGGNEKKVLVKETDIIEKSSNSELQEEKKPTAETEEQEERIIEVKPVVEKTHVAEKKVADESKGLKIFSYIALIIIFACVAIVAYFYVPSFHELGKSAIIEQVEQEMTEGKVEEETLQLQEDAIELGDVPEVDETEATSTPTSDKETSNAKLDPKKSYEIAGTMHEYTVQRGESLSDISVKFYGNKGFWNYIVKHNPTAIKNPDNVPYGTKIQIPLLKEK